MRTPTEVFREQLSSITEGRFADVLDLYAEDVVVEQPFMLPQPLRIVGKDALRAHFAGAPANLKLVVSNVIVRRTDDPEVVVGEWDYTVNGRGSLANVIIMRVRDGLIVASRDYHNHAAIGSLASAATDAG
ncbi:MAG TPA: nuclear transport factor 2 family protein [Pseudonocardiaceae bacterium]|jgi:ketosteroid isomerase-like protein